MSDYKEEFKEKLNKILDDFDNLDLSDFTFELLDCIWADIVQAKEEEDLKSLVEAYANEVESSLKIFNPELKQDIETLEKVLKELEFYIEAN